MYEILSIQKTMYLNEDKEGAQNVIEWCCPTGLFT